MVRHLSLFFFCLLVISVVITGCSRKEKEIVYKEPVFRVDKKVELEMILEDPIMPEMIYDIEFHKGKLVLMYDLNERFLHFFDAKTGEALGNALHKGRGPGEVIYPAPFLLDRETGALSIFDRVPQQFFSGNIDSLYNGSGLSLVDEEFGSSKPIVISLPQGYFFQEVPIVSEPERRYSLKKHNGEVVKYEGYPIDNFILLHSIYPNNKLGFSKDGTKMVAAANPGLIMEFFDLRDGIKKTHTRFYRKILLENDGSIAYERSGWGIADFYCTNKYVYATLGEPNTNKRFNNIAIFDWEGKPLKIFRTKYKKLIRICVDDEERILYICGEKDDGNYFLARLDLTKN